MDDLPVSRVEAIYVVLGEDLAAVETLLISRHPNGSITASPKDCPEIVFPITPDPLENVRRMHHIATIERDRKMA